MPTDSNDGQRPDLADFAVPANGRAIERPPGEGILAPAPEPLVRRSGPADQVALERFRSHVRDQVVGVLLDRAALRVTERYLTPARTDEAPRLTSPLKAPRGHWAWLLLLALAAAAVAVGVVLIAPAEEIQSVPSTTIVATTTTAVSTTTTTEPPQPTLGPVLGEVIVVDALRLRARDPIDAFGLLCVVFDISGPAPLVFIPAETSVELVGGRVFAPMLDITTGRAPIGPVYGDASPQTREVCWPAEGWQTSDLVIRYGFDDAPFEWVSRTP